MQTKTTITRLPERLTILISTFNKDEVKSTYLRTVVGISSFKTADVFVKKWNRNWEEMKAFWKENTNFTVSQLLLKFKIIPKFVGSWKFTEDEEFLVKNQILNKRDLSFYKVKINNEFQMIPLAKIDDDYLELIAEFAPSIEISDELEFRKFNDY